MITPHRPTSDPPPDSFEVVTPRLASEIDRDRSGRFLFRVPGRWRSPVPRNPFAVEAEREVLRWFEALGCTAAEVDRARRFDAAGYVGIPFPSLSLESTLRMGKYLSLWLLWDDVEVETLGNCWRIDAAAVLSGRRPEGMTRFDEGWWQLLRELAMRRTPRWISDLCAAMASWSAAAVEEAEAIAAYREHAVYLDFDRQLALRIATIGMFATVYLLEDAYDAELPRELHASPAVVRLKVLSNEIVGLGNDILSFGKDHAERQLNLASTLMHEQGVSMDAALERLVHMHDEAVEEYDAVADSLGPFSAEEAPLVTRWLQDVRYASLGFSLWESQAPRSTAHQVVHHGRPIEPRFPSFYPAPPSTRRLGSLFGPARLADERPSPSLGPSSSRRPPPPTLRAGPSSIRRTAVPSKP